MKSNAAAKPAGDVVDVSVTIAAQPETVWSFFNDGPRFASWIGAFAGQAPMPDTRIDPRVGGELRICYPSGHVTLGQITAMEPMQRIAFSWGYENKKHGVGPGESNVELTLTPVAGGTLVRLRHSGLPDDATTREQHLGGWTHYLAMLGRMSAAAQNQQAAERAFDTYFRAWPEADAAKRRELLAAACESDVQLRTDFACTDDINALDKHIAGSQKHMPGITLRGDGPVQTVHGHARVNWAAAGPDGTVIFRGTNFAILSPGGKLARVVGFN